MGSSSLNISDMSTSQVIVLSFVVVVVVVVVIFVIVDGVKLLEYLRHVNFTGLISVILITRSVGTLTLGILVG